MKDVTRPSLKGFLLLPSASIHGYYGVNRQPFEPSIIDINIAKLASVQRQNIQIWELHPPGWRREAYRIYEDNMIDTWRDDLYMLSNIDAAQAIQNIIQPHMGLYEIIACEIWEDINKLPDLSTSIEHTVLGFDIAYPGGEYYSAILNGLFVNASPELLHEYGLYLNAFGLFSSSNILPPYLKRYREIVSSETNSDFSAFRLNKT